MRKLASIQKIKTIEEIPGAVNVVKVTVLGWELVAKRTDFKEGDFCVFFETDSLLPKDNPVFSFMEGRKYRVKTIKMAGQVSQGLALPINLFPELTEIQEGMDLTERLGITKYEKEDVDPEIKTEKQTPLIRMLLKNRMMRKILLPFVMKNKGGFPSDIISKSDETRIQCMPGILEEEKDSDFYATEKLEGESASFTAIRRGWFWVDFKVCSRNLSLNRSGNEWWKMYDAYRIKDYLKAFLSVYGRKVNSVAIQGEIIGPKICKNIYARDFHDLYVYRVKMNCRDGSSVFLNPEEMQRVFDTCQFGFDIDKKIKVVPVIWKGKLSEFKDVNSILEFADGFSVLKADQLREGLVFSKQNDPDVSFKSVSRKYLLWKAKKEDACSE